MRVAIAGGHGQVALRLLPLLAERGHQGAGLIRKPEQADDLRAVGAEPIVCDLEREEENIAPAVAGYDAVVFAAGSGPGSGEERKRTMDLGGALKLIEAAKANGIRRYVMVSSMGADRPPPEGGNAFGAYLRAKGEADRALAGSGLDFTIVRPGRLTDDSPTGRVTVGASVPRGSISRADIAAVLLAVLENDASIGKTFELVAGETPISKAIAGL
jgi:uncharacterized protein YbjT (DUF2867 family)